MEKKETWRRTTQVTCLAEEEFSNITK